MLMQVARIHGSAAARGRLGGLASANKACNRSRLEANCRRGLTVETFSGASASELSTLATSSSTALATASDRIDDATDAVKMLALQPVWHLRMDLATERGRATTPSAVAATAAGVRLRRERRPVGNRG